MKKLSLHIAVALFLLKGTWGFTQSTDHVPGDLIVLLNSNASIVELQKEIAATVAGNFLFTNQKLLSRHMNIWLLHFNATSFDENQILRLAQRSSDVKLAQFNHYITPRNQPDDPDFSSQWNMLNIGQSGGTSGADIRTTSTWDYTIGGTTALGDTIVIAVVDDGFDLNHEDIHFWKNFNEVPNNGIDDDNNGYIDDFNGWDAFNHNDTILSDSHGTHVSGIAGAIGNNNKGVTGVNWNAQIMPIRGASGTESVVVEAYGYALEQRAKYNETEGDSGALVVATNSSFGVNNGNPIYYPLWCAMYDSLGKYGIISAAATTNSFADVDVIHDMPTTCSSDYLITVTSTNRFDQHEPSGYGLTTIDLGAPGKDIISTLPGNSYGYLTGTSMASPHVAGAVALLCSTPCTLFAQAMKIDPAGTALSIKQFILNGVDTLSDLVGKTVSAGRLNTLNSLLLLGAYYNCNLGIDESVSKSDISVFPNPASSNVTITYAALKQKSILKLVDVTGKLLLQKELSQNSTNIFLDISSFGSGCYFIFIQNSDESLNPLTLLKP